MYEKSKKYNVIYADPPWEYDNKSVIYADSPNSLPSVSGRYNQMPYEAILKIPIRELCQKDAVCFLWVTNPMLIEGLGLLAAWGFKYKTMLTWKKTTGSGYWFRGVTEHLLFGVRGNVPAFRSGLSNFHECRSGKHSQKPHYFRDLISKAIKKSIKEPAKLELFARSRDGLFPDYEYDGWDVYGNEVNNSIKL